MTFLLTSLSLYIFTIWKRIVYYRLCSLSLFEKVTIIKKLNCVTVNISLICITKYQDNFLWLFEFVGGEWIWWDVTISTQVIKYNQCWSRRISQSDSRINIKLNYSFFLHTVKPDRTYHRLDLLFVQQTERCPD